MEFSFFLVESVLGWTEGIRSQTDNQEEERPQKDSLQSSGALAKFSSVNPFSVGLESLSYLLC
jgi:hypothetical protein